jgi:response regulator RpfG family c-di-GMP phosphodiesterase
MKSRVLFVDDDPNILSAFRSILRKEYQVVTVEKAEEAIDLLSSSREEPFEVIVSDLRMPGVSGIECLKKARKIQPDAIRILLTGHADVDTAIESVNEGYIFRFLTKPCSKEVLRSALSAGVEQYRLVQAEKELLQKTLSGSVKVLVDILSLANPMAFGRANRLRRIMKELANALDVEEPWEFELAGMLSQIGCIALPGEVLESCFQNRTPTALEKKMFQTYPQIGYDLLKNIPRLQNVAEIIRYQEKDFNGGGTPEDKKAGEDIPLGARALHVAIAYDTIKEKGDSWSAALVTLQKETGKYDPHIVEILGEVGPERVTYELQEVMLKDLQPGMIIAEDILTNKGLLVISKGQEMTPALETRLRAFDNAMSIAQPFKMLVPQRKREESGVNGEKKDENKDHITARR